jgi:hypothetical protein
MYVPFIDFILLFMQSLSQKPVPPVHPVFAPPPVEQMAAPPVRQVFVHQQAFKTGALLAPGHLVGQYSESALKASKAHDTSKEKTVLCFQEFMGKNCKRNDCCFVHPSFRNEKFRVTGSVSKSCKSKMCEVFENVACKDFISCTGIHRGEYISKTSEGTYNLYRFSRFLNKDVVVSVFSQNAIDIHPHLRKLIR